MTLNLQYLDFDASENTDGVGTFEAMASTAPQHIAKVHAEIAQVLAWAHATFPGTRGPLDEGGEWDYDLQEMREFTIVDTLRYDVATCLVTTTPGTAGTPRHTVTLSISGTESFCAALREVLG
jgi:hypothetical protein